MRIGKDLSNRAGLRILAVIGIGNLLVLQYWLRRSPFNSDAKEGYLPLARRLLAEGPAFLGSPEAIQVPIFAYVWPALFGADLATQKIVSLGLSLVVLALLFRTGRLLHSPLAGLLCSAAYAFSPLVWPLASTAGVEPLFLFLTACWIWALAEGTAGRNRAFIGAGIAIGLAAMTRATTVYFLPVMAIVALVLSRIDRDNRAMWQRICGAHLLGIAIVAPILVANAYRYGLYAISTGAGAALFSGTHPLVYGFEQHYFDSVIDIAAVLPPGMPHLEIEADRMLASVGTFMLFNLEPRFVAEMYAHKLFAFLFVANREWVEPAIYLRTFRVLLCVLAFASAGWAIRKPVLLCVWASLIFQTALHLPALFSFRYSVLVLDIGLCLLAGLGLARMLVERQGARLTVCAVAFVCLASLGAWHAATYPNFPEINLYDVPHLVEQQFRGETLPVSRLDGIAKVAPGRYRFESTPAVMEIDLSLQAAINPYQQHYLAIHATAVAPRADKKACNEFLAAFQPQAAPPGRFGSPQPFDWVQFGAASRAVIGGYWKLGFRGPGVFRLSFACPIGSELQIAGMELVQPVVGVEYRTAYLRSIGKSAWSDPPQLGR